MSIIIVIGRCARAGRVGTAYNIISPDEYAYLLDLHLFLGRPLNIVPSSGSIENTDGIVGKMPQAMIEEELAELINWHSCSTDLVCSFDRFVQRIIKDIIFTFC